jgi:cyclophilin family peptidyl-prolyl cis-trans isomerase/HEAT repeat protein
VKKLVLVVLILFFYSLQYSQPISRPEREILQLQDQRVSGDGTLVRYLKDQSARLRYRAALALANLQDSSTVPALAASLKDTATDVREASALALGQIKTERAANELLSTLSIEMDTNVIARILEALGKCGSQKCLDSLLTISELDSTKFPPNHFALCIARFAIRQIRTERSIWKCFEYIGSGSPATCSAALYALWRSAPNGLVDLEISKQKDELISLAHHRSSEVRMNLAILLGRSKSKNAQEILDTLERGETSWDDWHVWVQIIRAQAALSAQPENLLPKYLDHLSAMNNHIKITVLQTVKVLPFSLDKQSLFLDSLLLKLRTFVNDASEHEAVRGEACVALGKHFPKDLDLLLPWLTDNRISPRLKAKLLEGIAQQVSKEHLLILRNNLNHESNRVSMAAWDFIKPMLYPGIVSKLGLDSIESIYLSRDIYQKAKIALAKNDMGVTTVLASLFADTAIFKKFKIDGYGKQIVDDLITACRNLSHYDDREAKQAILQTLGNINDTSSVPFLVKELLEPDRSVAAEAGASLHHMTGKDYSSRLPEQAIAPHTDEDWNLLERIKPNQHVLIRTNSGEFTLELMKEQAPFTVLSFVKLTKNKYFDELYFHRVIPDFVVQGGDPRGDGWGGPGFSLRSEISLANYEQGSCGMASAGKDTEGSQFFICHISTPHLDGRYTIFGKVQKGMDVVDRLQIGDTILTVQLVEE